VKAIAFYLPQFHPIPENDAWWGPGFTEWTNVVRAKPCFPGHEQPRLPADLGFYDLRLPETRSAQARLAAESGIDGFCYYHYWFAGRRLLERPFEEVLRSGEPDFPFCLCWANEPWTRRWDGTGGPMLVGQSYSAWDDLQHARWLASAFDDARYIRVDGRPLFLVYRAHAMPDPRRTIERWRQELDRLGVSQPHLVRVESFPDERDDPIALGFDAAVEFQPDAMRLPPPLRRERHWRLLRSLGLGSKAYGTRSIFDYRKLAALAVARPRPEYAFYRCVTPSWDNSPRRPDGEGWVFTGSTPEEYERWLAAIVDEETVRGAPLVFLNAWNEWAEGNHLEPCQRWGHEYLHATARALGRRESAEVPSAA
jgi:lipopolysaccharide biosynthesis protein